MMLRCERLEWCGGVSSFALEPAGEFFGGERPAEVVALAVLAAHLGQLVPGVGGLDAFGDDV